MENKTVNVAGRLVVLTGATMLGAMLAEPAMAQVRAAFVKDLDNPARQPFAVNTGASNFSSGQSSLTVNL